jgi:hypothetical protein
VSGVDSILVVGVVGEGDGPVSGEGHPQADRFNMSVNKDITSNAAR